MLFLDPLKPVGTGIEASFLLNSVFSMGVEMINVLVLEILPYD
jgi:hypothetical protein